MASALRVSARRCRTPILGIDTPLSIFLRKEVGSGGLRQLQDRELGALAGGAALEPSVVLGKNFFMTSCPLPLAVLRVNPQYGERGRLSRASPASLGNYLRGRIAGQEALRMPVGQWAACTKSWPAPPPLQDCGRSSCGPGRQGSSGTKLPSKCSRSGRRLSASHRATSSTTTARFSSSSRAMHRPGCRGQGFLRFFDH